MKLLLLLSNLSNKHITINQLASLYLCTSMFNHPRNVDIPYNPMKKCRYTLQPNEVHSSFFSSSSSWQKFDSLFTIALCTQTHSLWSMPRIMTVVDNVSHKELRISGISGRGTKANTGLLYMCAPGSHKSFFYLFFVFLFLFLFYCKF